MTIRKKSIAVFLDRDGTICEEVGYLDRLEQVRLIPGAPAAIRLLNLRGIKVVVVTNQSGVARGLFSEARLKEVHEELERQLAEEGARLDGLYYCPHHPSEGEGPYLKECGCRKPARGLLDRAASDLNLNLRACYMIGDHYSDVACGLGVGAKSILLLTGHGREALQRKETWPAPPSRIAADLYQAVEWVLKDLGQ